MIYSLLFFGLVCFSPLEHEFQVRKLAFIHFCALVPGIVPGT